MSFAYMPLFTGDYIRDTMHLSCAEHGIYLRLLMYCWDSKGPAPADERKRCGIVNARSSDEVEAMRRVMNEFFVEMEDGWYNERMQNEVVKSEILSKSRSEYGRIGAAIKAQSQVRRAKAAHAEHKLSLSQAQVKLGLLTSSSSPSSSPEVLDANASRTSNGDANLRSANAVDLTTPPSNQKGVGKKSKKPSSRASRLTPTWALPLEWGEWALQERPELTRDQVRIIASNFHDHWLGEGATKADWYATWRKWVRTERLDIPKTVADQNQAAVDAWKRQHNEKTIDEDKS